MKNSFLPIPSRVTAAHIFVCLLLSVVSVGHSRTLRAADIEVPASRPFGRAAVMEERIYYFGGGSDQVDIFDSKRSSWSQASVGLSSPQLLGDQINDQLYLLDPGSRKLLRFDPATKKVENLADIPTRRINATVVACGKRLYVIGGYSEDVNERNCVEVYDPSTNRWSLGPPLPGYRPLDHFHSAAVLNGKLHVLGGLLEGNEDQPHWQQDGDRWTARAQPPLHAMWKHVALVAAAGKLYLIAPLTIYGACQSDSVNAAMILRYLRATRDSARLKTCVVG